MKLYISMALALYVISLFLRILRKSRLSFIAFSLAALVAMIVVAHDWRVSGQPPFSSMHHVMLVLGACALPGYVLFVMGRGLRWMAPVFSLAGAIPLVLALVFKRDEAWNLAPALQSPWFVPHVIAYMVSYSLALIAFLLLLAGGIIRLRGKSVTTDPSRLESGSYEILSVAFPLMTFGMLSGALWANQIWGDYWSWDSKETWSLITWFLYLCYFHCRKHGQLRRYANLSHVLAFLALVTTFLLVNLLPKLASKMHSYV
jgi:ABC-type transport system involved in cytochrome c biogenesis permease subunit